MVLLAAFLLAYRYLSCLTTIGLDDEAPATYCSLGFYAAYKYNCFTSQAIVRPSGLQRFFSRSSSVYASVLVYGTARGPRKALLVTEQEAMLLL